MKDNKSALWILFAVLMLGLLTGCALHASAAKSNDSLTDEQENADNNAAILQDATAWFEQQTTRHEIICGEVHDDFVVFLTGTKNPGTDSYQLLQAFVVQKKNDSFTVAAMNDGYCSISAGVSAYVLATENLTVIYGDTRDSVFDFVNDRRIGVDFTEVNILLRNGEAETRKIAGNAPYLLVIAEAVAVADIEFVSADLTVSYSTFYSTDLMDHAVSYDVSAVFE